MAWKATGQPTVRKQRDKWVVRVDGIDTATGKHRPKQLGTYQSQRSANAAAREMRSEEAAVTKGTVSWLVRRYVAGRTDITPNRASRSRRAVRSETSSSRATSAAVTCSRCCSKRRMATSRSVRTPTTLPYQTGHGSDRFRSTRWRHDLTDESHYPRPIRGGVRCACTFVA